MNEKKNYKILLCETKPLLARKIEKIIFTVGAKALTFDKIPSPETLEDIPVLSLISENLVASYLELFQDLSIPTIIIHHNNLPKLLNFTEKIHFNNFLAEDQNGSIRNWELLYILRRLINHTQPTGLKSILNWGARIHETTIKTTSELRKAVDWTAVFCTKLGTPPKIRDAFSELAHEVLMNAVYDAPINEAGEAIYAHNRKMDVILQDHQSVLFSMGTDGDYIGLRVKDPFGRLKRQHVFGGLQRALTQGKLDIEGGGAGLGMSYIYQHGIASFFSVIPDEYTEVIVIYDLSLNRRIFSSLPRSVHFFHNQLDKTT